MAATCLLCVACFAWGNSWARAGLSLAEYLPTEREKVIFGQIYMLDIEIADCQELLSRYQKKGALNPAELLEAARIRGSLRAYYAERLQLQSGLNQ